VLDEIHARFWVGLEPLRKSGKLGAILLQYPEWFPIGSKNKAEILHARELLPDDTLAVEFRNHTWLEERNQAETLAFLRDNGLSYVSVDEPQGFPVVDPAGRRRDGETRDRPLPRTQRRELEEARAHRGRAVRLLIQAA
jgi:uncharacterized protein YecE (DUF72 family)